MTLLLPSLLLLVALLPGWVARQRIRQVGGHRPADVPLAQAGLEALVWSAGLHALPLVLGRLLGPVAAGPTLATWLALLSPDAAAQTGALIAAAPHLGALAGHLGAVLALALLLPTALRRLITRLRLDRRRSRWAALLRAPQAPWYYLFSGADFAADTVPDLVAVSAVLDVAGQPFLYKGIVDEYFVDREGRLDRLVLQQVVRRPVGPGLPSARGVAGREALESVDGDCVVLRCDEASLLRVEYIRLTRTGEPPSRQPPADLLGQGFEPTQPV
jgi:hypothetical protein